MLHGRGEEHLLQGLGKSGDIQARAFQDGLHGGLVVALADEAVLQGLEALRVLGGDGAPLPGHGPIAAAGVGRAGLAQPRGQLGRRTIEEGQEAAHGALAGGELEHAVARPAHMIPAYGLRAVAAGLEHAGQRAGHVLRGQVLAWFRLGRRRARAIRRLGLGGHRRLSRRLGGRGLVRLTARRPAGILGNLELGQGGQHVHAHRVQADASAGALLVLLVFPAHGHVQEALGHGQVDGLAHGIQGFLEISRIAGGGMPTGLWLGIARGSKADSV